jgi:hypothetical protein
MRFLATIELSGRSATGIPVPEHVIDQLGDGKRRFPVRVTIGGHTYRSTVGPYQGKHMLPLSAANREACGVAAGDEVEVDLEPDGAPRTVDVPDDLAAALRLDTTARRFFEGLSYSHQNAYVTWIDDAKKPETRARRVSQAVERLHDGRSR